MRVFTKVVAVLLMTAVVSAGVGGCANSVGNDGSLFVGNYRLWDPYRAAYYQPVVVYRHTYDVNFTGAGRFGSTRTDYYHGGNWNGWNGNR